MEDISDLGKSVERLGDYYEVTIPLGDNTLAAQDYIGDTTNDAGIPMPQGELEAARVTLGAADDGNTTVQIDNETANNNHSFDLDADTYTAETGIGLYFSEGDELSAQVTSVTTPGDGLSIHLRFKVDPAPMN